MIFKNFLNYEIQQLRKAQANLPVHKYKDLILETIKNNQITIIAGI